MKNKKKSKKQSDNITDCFDLKSRYELIIKARNFHYENFNKWMTYFYLMISALVLGLCNILSARLTLFRASTARCLRSADLMPA